MCNLFKIFPLLLLLIAPNVFSAQQNMMTAPATTHGDVRGVINNNATAAQSNFVELYSAKATIPVVSNAAYDATAWLGDTAVPTKNAIRNKIEAMILAGGSVAWPASDGNNYIAKNGAWVLLPTNISGNAATATALVVNGTDCSAGYASTGIDAQGNATGCTQYEPYNTNLITLGTPTPWRLFYSNGSSVINQLAPGAFGTILQSNGPTAAPSFVATGATFDPTQPGPIGGTTPNTATFTSVTLGQVSSSAADGNRWSSIPNTVALTGPTTFGNISWLTDRYWIANGVNWISRWLASTKAGGTLALGTTTINSATCTVVQSPNNTAIVAGDVVSYSFHGNAPSVNGMLVVKAFSTTGYANFSVCNLTSAAITPGAVSVDWQVLL